MEQKIRRNLAITLIIALGLISGSILNGNNAEAQVQDPNIKDQCPEISCEHDLINGFRCFGTDLNTTCDDSEYPDGCSQDVC